METLTQKKLESWIEEIEKERLEDYKLRLKELRSADAEYDAYVSQYRTYSAEDLRDYGHTWGDGFGPESDTESDMESLPSYYKVEGRQLEILKEMIDNEHDEEDIRYMFLNLCGWDDEYPICQLGRDYTYVMVLRELLENYKKEVEFYRRNNE